MKAFKLIRRDGLYYNDTLIATCVDEDTQNDPKYTVYIYASVDNGELVLKLGKAEKMTVLERYSATGCDQKTRMIKVYTYAGGDTPLHRMLQSHAKNNVGFTAISMEDSDDNTRESYKIESLEGYNTFIKYVEDMILEEGGTCETKKSREDFSDVVQLVNEWLKETRKYILADLCTRWGKTGSILRYCKKLNETEGLQLFYMTSFIGTVKNSYKSDINKFTQNENCMFFDPNIDDVKDLKEWLKDKNHYAMYYVALTGDEDCCDRRLDASMLKVPHVVFVEEADFGAACPKQIAKLKKLNNKKCNIFMATSGTNREKCLEIINKVM